ncbi:J domain-containing protein [Nocardioides sp. W3-2-3]|uniref:J domain-containing protein n=1 Tax=Nocardioides convexus TaxID=2712224 RepID=UPI0024185A50|nr:hypothetical protein [Nocardioides convexus]NHA00696.1 J domain-containing protein [Nocardioides convexus]
MLVAGLVVSAIIVFGNGTGSGLGGKIDSVRKPPVSVSKDREQVLAAADTFATRFNTYGPDLLDQQGKMPKYAEVGTLMTAKFRTVFDQNVVLAEKTVSETGIARVANVLGTGISQIDHDSATVLIGTTVDSSYPSPDDPKERIDFAPQRFRYEISLVKVDGSWLVDDLDDLDDGLPSLGRLLGPGRPPGRPDAVVGRLVHALAVGEPEPGEPHAVSANLYDILDVEESATSEEIRAAWKSAVADLDPTDRRFRAYSDAAGVLLDDDKRAAYDAEPGRRAGGRRSGAGPGPGRREAGVRAGRRRARGDLRPRRRGAADAVHRPRGLGARCGRCRGRGRPGGGCLPAPAAGRQSLFSDRLAEEDRRGQCLLREVLDLGRGGRGAPGRAGVLLQPTRRWPPTSTGCSSTSAPDSAPSRPACGPP